MQEDDSLGAQGNLPNGGTLTSFQSELSLSDHHAIISPAADHPSRTATRRSSVFNLVATVIGGGCLSLPFAFQSSGVVSGVVLLAICGVLSGFSMQLLVSCSRFTGAQNYEECGEKAFGLKMKYATMCMLIAALVLISVGYLILTRDLATQLVESYLTENSTTLTTRNLILLFSISPIVPLCFAETLQSLRFASIIALGSLLLLTIAIVIRTTQKIQADPVRVQDITLVSTNVQDIFYAIPFMESSFITHFNLLPVQTMLKRPTRARTDQIISLTIMSSICFYVLLGTLGYLFAYDHKCGPRNASTCADRVPENILDAFELKDILIDCGRFGFLISLLFSFPLLILPCRETALRLLHAILAETSPVDEVFADQEDTNEEDPLARYLEQDRNEDRYTSLAAVAQSQDIFSPNAIVTEDISSVSAHLPLLVDRNEPNPIEARIGSLSLKSRRMIATAAVLSVSILLTIVIPQVAIVWNVMGSTVGMLLVFVFPCFFYIRIRQVYNEKRVAMGKSCRWDRKLLYAHVLRIASVVVTSICTVVSVKSALG